MAKKHFMIYYKKGTGGYVISEPRPWARENQHYFPRYDFSSDNHPTPVIIEEWLINNKNFQRGDFNNPTVEVIFNLDPNIDL